MITETKKGEGFTVELVKPLEEDLKFSWWIVEAKESE
jgi:hypothetical protein